MAQFLTVRPDTPGQGRSRFSKALPSVPGLTCEAPLPMTPRPPTPPAKTGDETSFKTSTSKTIARKPVMTSAPSQRKQPQQSQSPSSPPAPAPPPKPEAVEGPPEEEAPQTMAPPSPSYSLSSLLSAYSCTPDEPPAGDGGSGSGGGGAVGSAGSAGIAGRAGRAGSAGSACSVGSAGSGPLRLGVGGAGGAGSATATATMYSASETWPSPPLGSANSLCGSDWAAAAAAATAPPGTAPPSGKDADELPPPRVPRPSLPSPPPAGDDETHHDGGHLVRPPSRTDKQLPPPPPPSSSLPLSPSLRPSLSHPSSPSQPLAQGAAAELWRRRPAKAEALSAQLSGLAIANSHGSTASTASTAPAPASAPAPVSRKPLSNRSAPPHSPPLPPLPLAAQLTSAPSPPVPVVASPGRDVQPSAEQQAGSPPPPPSQAADAQAMGSKPSSLSQIKHAVRRNRSSANGAATKPGRTAGSQRPPTPDYHKGDSKAPVPVDVVVVSPVSPASPAPSVSPKPAHTAEDQVHRPPIPRKSLPSTLPAVTGLPSIGDALPSPPSDQPLSPQQRPPADPAGHGQCSVQSPLSDAPPPAADRLRSHASAPQFRGRDGTLYNEMRVTREADLRATYFPVQSDRHFAPGTFISARPPKESHFSCYQNHKNMTRRANCNCPITCQTCDKADTEDRWVCSFCYLRICDSCMRVLNGHQRVLRRLVDELAVNTPLSLSSMSRPGSALGLPAGKPS